MAAQHRLAKLPLSAATARSVEDKCGSSKLERQCY
jgi:hypothetical protein